MSFIEMPIPFYLSLIALVIGGVFAFKSRTKAWGLPALAVLGTAGVWYIGDALYNDYTSYKVSIGSGPIYAAWWQFLWFVVAFLCLVKPVHQRVNRNLLDRRSYVMLFVNEDVLGHPRLQSRIDAVAKTLFLSWGLIMAVALWKSQWNFVGLFAPYLGTRTDPWARGQIGGGISFLISLAAYIQIFLCAGIGVIAALAKNPRTRRTAIIIFALSFPYYFIDRTRNTIISTALPGLISFVFIRLRSRPWIKALILGGAFLVLNSWFLFILENRTSRSIANALANGETIILENSRHAGLNMFEELGWINYFFRSGAYEPNWGMRYFAEFVNPVPRAIWPNKPTIGLDYAIARGQSIRSSKGEVTATISTGMVGQGVVNFGPIIGPLASALLMCIWVAMVARQDLLGANPDRLLLYALGLVLTFNLGRDITFLTTYPFLFGWMIIWAGGKRRRLD